MRASALTLALCALLASGASAGDLGESVVFDAGTQFSLEATVDSGGRVVYDSGPSGEQSEDSDTVLFHGEMKGDAAFEVSRRLDTLQWGPWTTAYVKRYPDGRFWGKAALPYGRGPLRVRAHAASGRVRSIKIYAVEVFLSTEGERRGGGGATAGPAPGLPSVHGRAEWHAAAPSDEYEPQVPNRMTYHHSDGRYTTTLADSLREVKVIQDFHMHGRGWTDIAYHYLIDAAGDIIEGRPELVVGAHAGNHEWNLDNVGVCLLGTYNPPKNDPVTAQELDALVSVGRYLVARYHIDPNIKGHRDYHSTDCPGDELYAKRAWLRQQIARPAPAVPAAPAGLTFRPIAIVAPAFR